MRYGNLIFPLIGALLAPMVHAQEWVNDLDGTDVDWYDIKARFDLHWQGRQHEKGKGYKQMQRLDAFLSQRVYPSGRLPDLAAYAEAVRQWRSASRAPMMRTAVWTELGPLSWTSMSYNPGNGRINCVVEDPNDPGTIYLGAPAGGLWRSTDDGQSWSALLDDLPPIGVSGIAIDPTNSATLYIATGDGDGGDTYALGVLKSTDGGVTWNMTGLDWPQTITRTTRRLIMHPTDPQTLLCATNSGLWKTTDGGTTWTQRATGSFFDAEYKPGDPNIVYACTDRFLRSTDGGDSFTQVTTGVPPEADVNRMAIAVTAVDPTMVYLLCGREDNSGYKGLYRSTDSGLTFSTRSTGPNIFGYQQNGSDNGGQCWYDMALAADPTDADVIYAGGVNVWRSANGGTTWTIKSHWTYPSVVGYTHADIHALELFNGRLYCGSDGGIFRSTNNGNDWDDLSAGLGIMQSYRLGVSATVDAQVITGAQDNGMNLLDGGTWTHVQGADGMEGIIDPTDAQIQYGSSQNGSLYRTYDAWQNTGSISGSITEDGAWVTPYVMAPQDPLTLVAGYNNLWITHDRGNNWSQLTNYGTNLNVRAIAIAPSDDQVMYFSNDAWMRRTTNGGVSWQFADAGLPDLSITSIAVDHADPLHVLVSLSGYDDGDKVFESFDGGAVWTNITSNLPNVPANSLVLSTPDHGIYVGTDLGVYYIDDLLGIWQPFSQGMPPAIVTELELDTAESMLYAATFGRGTWRTPVHTPASTPPVPAFTVSGTSACPGDAVHFADASLDAAPGWDWSFPGGTPSTGSDPTVDVIYPTSGIYPVTLEVANGFGTAQTTIDITVTIEPNMLDLALTFDDYPGETSWTITSDQDGAIVATGGPYAGVPAGSSTAVQVCLPDGCYALTMYDGYGDGMCCGFGQGSYVLSDQLLGTLASGGEFATEESTAFCVTFPVGVAEGPARDAIQVYTVDPQGLFRIRPPQGCAMKALDVLDPTGRSVMHVGNTDGGSWLIDLRTLASGIYSIAVCGGASGPVRVVRP
ncbi:MAG: PKD domain-containing protein [Flavobacteriales bacterium]|nr:PKD domain-containing protein [Flavobacteriales bacterium]MCB9167550.1 PKD domain-containing protein [Flavobacteriales bacterium]